MYYLIFLISPHIQKQHALQQKEEDALRTFSEDRLKHPAVTASFNLYESHQKKFTSVIKERTKKILRLEKNAFLFSAFSGLAGYITIISIDIFGAILLYKGKLTIGSFIAMSQVSSVVLWPFKFLPNVFKSMAKKKAALKRLNDFENLGQEKQEPQTENFEAVKLIAKDLSFKYSEKNVFENFNYEAECGVLNCIAGESGKGKSTLAKLLLGLYEPNNGEIYFLDKQNRKHKISRNYVSYIPQDCKLFAKTIYENIADGKANASKEEIQVAAKKSMAHNFIEERDEKYDSFVDNSSDVISYGQKQRIAIARAVLKDAKLIVFDEPSSALDKENEAEIISLLHELSKDKIVVVISHSQNIIETAENQLFL